MVSRHQYSCHGIRELELQIWGRVCDVDIVAAVLDDHLQHSLKRNRIIQTENKDKLYLEAKL